MPRCQGTVLALVLATCCACSSGPGASRPRLRAVALPEMSSAAADVQRQIGDRFSALQAAIARDATPAADLAVAYGDMGRLFTAAEFYAAAESCFENARVLAPSDMRWPYFLGHVFRYENDQPRAEAAFAAALALSPQHVPSLVWLAEMHLQQNRPDQAGPLLARAQALDAASGGSGSGAVFYGLGRVALANGDYAAAAAHLERALTLRPEATRLHYPLAMAYRGLKQQAKADDHLARRGEVDLPPADPLMSELRGLLQNASAHEVLASQAIEARRWADAVTSLRQAIELAPDNAFSRLNLATSLYMTGDAGAALEQYRAALRISPGLARAHFGIGVIMSARGADAEAIQALTAAVAADPAYVEARFSLANALRRTGRVEEALAHYDTVLRTDPAVSQAGFGIAMGLVRLGRYAEARRRLETDVRAFPDQTGFAHALARLLAAAPDPAVRDGARALTLVDGLVKREQSLSVGETMAMALAETGRFDEAVAWQRNVLASAPEGKARLTANLRLYESRQPCREPWATDDPVHRPQ